MWNLSKKNWRQLLIWPRTRNYNYGMSWRYWNKICRFKNVSSEECVLSDCVGCVWLFDSHIDTQSSDFYFGCGYVCAIRKKEAAYFMARKFWGLREQQSIFRQSYLPDTVNSFWGPKNGSSSILPTDNPMEVGNRRIFLQCVQYFTLRGIWTRLNIFNTKMLLGIPELMEYVAEAVAGELQNWKLTDVKSKSDMRELFDRIGSRIGYTGLLTKLVAPLENDGVRIHLFFFIYRHVFDCKFLSTRIRVFVVFSMTQVLLLWNFFKSSQVTWNQQKASMC